MLEFIAGVSPSAQRVSDFFDRHPVAVLAVLMFGIVSCGLLEAM